MFGKAVDFGKDFPLANAVKSPQKRYRRLWTLMVKVSVGSNTCLSLLVLAAGPEHHREMDESAPIQVPKNVANPLAWMNTILGLQRTLLAAERTAVTLIAFGLVIY